MDQCLACREQFVNDNDENDNDFSDDDFVDEDGDDSIDDESEDGIDEYSNRLNERVDSTNDCYPSYATILCYCCRNEFGRYVKEETLLRLAIAITEYKLYLDKIKFSTYFKNVFSHIDTHFDHSEPEYIILRKMLMNLHGEYTFLTTPLATLQSQINKQRASSSQPSLNPNAAIFVPVIRKKPITTQATETLQLVVYKPLSSHIITSQAEHLLPEPHKPSSND